MPTLIEEDKFETGGTWDSTEGTPTIVSTPVPQSATRSVHLNPSGAAESIRYNSFNGTQSRVVVGMWLRVVSPSGSGEARLMGIWCGAGTTFALQKLLVSADMAVSMDGTPSVGSQYKGSAIATDTWYWSQIMVDISANPWEVRGKIDGAEWSGTGAAAGSTIPSSGYVKIGTDLTNTYTVYVGHLKIGTASSDSDWWPEPAAVTTSSGAGRLLLLGVG